MHLRGELSSCDFLGEARGDIFPSFPDATVVLLCLNTALEEGCALWGLGQRGTQPCRMGGPALFHSGPPPTACCVLLQWQWLLLHTSVRMPSPESWGHTTGHRVHGALMPAAATLCASSLVLELCNRALFWRGGWKSTQHAVTPSVTFSYQVVSIFNLQTACISIFSLFIILHCVLHHNCCLPYYFYTIDHFAGSQNKLQALLSSPNHFS